MWHLYLSNICWVQTAGLGKGHGGYFQGTVRWVTEEACGHKKKERKVT
jgi:hypothetical protein